MVGEQIYLEKKPGNLHNEFVVAIIQIVRHIVILLNGYLETECIQHLI